MYLYIICDEKKSYRLTYLAFIQKITPLSQAQLLSQNMRFAADCVQRMYNIKLCGPNPFFTTQPKNKNWPTILPAKREKTSHTFHPPRKNKSPKRAPSHPLSKGSRCLLNRDATTAPQKLSHREHGRIPYSLLLGLGLPGSWMKIFRSYSYHLCLNDFGEP